MNLASVTVYTGEYNLNATRLVGKCFQRFVSNPATYPLDNFWTSKINLNVLHWYSMKLAGTFEFDNLVLLVKERRLYLEYLKTSMPSVGKVHVV